MNIYNIQNKYENQKTFANVKSFLKKVNELLELKPTDYVHCNMYESEFDNLYRKLLVNNHRDVLYKMTTLVGIIKKFDVTRANGLLDKISGLKSSDLLNIQIEEQEPQFRQWSEMLQLFDEEIETNLNRNSKIVCVCFKHGYCLSIGEIYNTTTKLGRPGVAFNHLDLDNLVWTVTEHKNAHLGKRIFQVTQEFADEIRKYIELPDYLLIYKSTFEPYTTNLLSSIGIDTFTTDEVRNSYLYYIWSTLSKEYATKISSDVIGYLPEAIKKFSVKYKLVGRNDLQGSDPHPLYFEDPNKYSVNGRLRVNIKLRSTN